MPIRPPSAGPSSGRSAGRSAVRLAALGLLAALACSFAAHAAAQGARFTRPVEVPEAGWVRVPLAPEILREAAPAGGSLRLFGPEGEEVPFRRVPSAAGGDWVAADVVSETRAATGWLVVLGISGGEAGTAAGDPPRHDRVRVELDGAASTGPTGAVQVEVSDDGSAWRLSTVGRVERSSGAASANDAAVVELAYPATDARFLRLSWTPIGVEGTGVQPPEAEDAPAVRSASVEAVPARSLGITIPRPECRSAAAQRGDEGDQADESEDGGDGEGLDRSGDRSVGPRAVCSLPVVAAGQHLRRLDLVVTAEGRVGFRLLVPEDGRWEPVTDGVWTSPLPETPHSLGLDLDLPRPAEPLRLELYGGTDAVPGLARADAELGAEALVFRARRAGRHTLAYGAGVFSSSRSDQVRVPPGVEPQRIEPGPEDEGSAPSAEAPLPESAGPAPSVQFARRWTVQADSPVAGGLYRLPLAPETYAVARPDLADLRLLSGDVQVPFVRWRPAEPATVTTVHRAISAPTDGTDGAAGPLRVGIDLETDGLPLSALVVHAAPVSSLSSSAGGAPVVRRRVRVLAVEPPTPGGEASSRALSPWLDWTCTPRPPLSCRLAIALAGAREEGVRRAGRLELEIAGSGTGPAGGGSADAADLRFPGGIDLELWRRQDLLLFPWPSGDAPFRLTAGAEDLEAPDYDLAGRRDELLARPSRRAEMVSLAAAARSGRAGGWVSGWTVALTLAVALAVLLALLDRILAKAEPAPPSGRADS